MRPRSVTGFHCVIPLLTLLILNLSQLAIAAPGGRAPTSARRLTKSTLRTEAGLESAPTNNRLTHALAAAPSPAAPTGTGLEEPWVRVTNLPAYFGEFLKDPYGLTIQRVDAFPLTPGPLRLETLMDQPQVPFLLQTSVAQALGSIMWAGFERDSKEVMDANAVFLGEAGIFSYIEAPANHRVAIVILADEGSRDYSASLQMGSVYFHQYGKRAFMGLSDLRRELNRLRALGVELRFYVGDALEHTNGMVGSEAREWPTNSWSLAAVFDGFDSLANDNFRIGGVSFSAPSDGGVTPFDLPSEAYPKMARARGLQVDTPAYTDFMNHRIVFILGPRATELRKDYEEASRRHKHAALLQDARRLQETFPGLRIVSPGDGDLMPRVVAEIGVDLDGYGMDVFGRSGGTEAMAALIPARNHPQGQFSHTHVAKSATDNDYGRAVAYNYTPSELEMYADLQIPDTVYRPDLHRDPQVFPFRSKTDAPGRGVLVMTAVTGASPEIYGETFARRLQRIDFRVIKGTAGGHVITRSLVVTREGQPFVVQVTSETADLAKTQELLKQASPEARAYRPAAGMEEAKPLDLDTVRSLLEYAQVPAGAKSGLWASPAPKQTQTKPVRMYITSEVRTALPPVIQEWVGTGLIELRDFDPAHPPEVVLGSVIVAGPGALPDLRERHVPVIQSRELTWLTTLRGQALWALAWNQAFQNQVILWSPPSATLVRYEGQDGFAFYV